MRFVVLLCALLVFLLPVFACAENSAALQAGRDHLACAGWTVPDEAFAAFCESSETFTALLRDSEALRDLYAQRVARMNDPAAVAADLFAFAAHGDYDHDTDSWTPWFDAAYAFDVEIFSIAQMYTLFLQGVDVIALDAAITDVTEDLSGMTVEMDLGGFIPSDGVRSVSFLLNGHPHAITLESRGDWFNPDMIGAMNRVLEAEGCAGRLYGMAAEGQSLLLIYGSAAQAENTARYFGFLPEW